jgi:hypothetical protein
VLSRAVMLYFEPARCRTVNLTPECRRDVVGIVAAALANNKPITDQDFAMNRSVRSRARHCSVWKVHKSWAAKPNTQTLYFFKGFTLRLNRTYTIIHALLCRSIAC